MNWRQFRESRHFHALWIGVVLIALAIWFDVIWIVASAILGLSFAVLIIEWLISIWKSPERDSRRQD